MDSDPLSHSNLKRWLTVYNGHERLYKYSQFTLRKKAIIHQVTTMLATSKNVLFPGHSHLLTIGIDDPSLLL